MGVKNGSCRVRADGLPPDATGGWRVQFMLNGGLFSRSDAAAPYERVGDVATGPHVFTAVWTKTGSPTVTTPAVTFTCPQF